jgi:hypothetical protein
MENEGKRSFYLIKFFMQWVITIIIICSMFWLELLLKYREISFNCFYLSKENPK